MIEVLVLFFLASFVEASHFTFFVTGFYDVALEDKDPAVDPEIFGFFKSMANNLCNVVFAFHQSGSLEHVVKS
ncbi:MAG: hypothetical protein G01um101420_43 [Parcubacteria group bacterium Gr01-1014_20]|nr:MAG: hypothetical protein G01um101420_43 [Parcubacteria group bacterium Gr01-1014_20]